MTEYTSQAYISLGNGSIVVTSSEQAKVFDLLNKLQIKSAKMDMYYVTLTTGSTMTISGFGHNGTYIISGVGGGGGGGSCTAIVDDFKPVEKPKKLKKPNLRKELNGKHSRNTGKR